MVLESTIYSPIIMKSPAYNIESFLFKCQIWWVISMYIKKSGWVLVKFWFFSKSQKHFHAYFLECQGCVSDVFKLKMSFYEHMRNKKESCYQEMVSYTYPFVISLNLILTIEIIIYFLHKLHFSDFIALYLLFGSVKDYHVYKL